VSRLREALYSTNGTPPKGTTLISIAFAIHSSNQPRCQTTQPNQESQKQYRNQITTTTKPSFVDYPSDCRSWSVPLFSTLLPSFIFLATVFILFDDIDWYLHVRLLNIHLCASNCVFARHHLDSFACGRRSTISISSDDSQSVVASLTTLLSSLCCCELLVDSYLDFSIDLSFHCRCVSASTILYVRDQVFT
jgi:hypothetical protein